MRNPYTDLQKAFQYLECSARQRGAQDCCGPLPHLLRGGDSDRALRDYVFCLLLVSAVAQFELDLGQIRGVPGNQSTWRLSARLKLLRDHFRVPPAAFDAVDQIRLARNQFVHDGSTNVEAGCTKRLVPGILVTFLHHCQHPQYR